MICRVFKKKNHTRGFHPDMDQEEPIVLFHAPGGCTLEPKHYSGEVHPNNFTFDHNNSMHLPQLLSPESAVPSSFLSSLPLSSTMELQCPQNLLRLTSGGAGPSTAAPPSAGFIQQERFSGDWSFLDKLLATHQTMDHISKCHQFSHVADLVPPGQKFPFSYHGFEPDFSKYSK